MLVAHRGITGAARNIGENTIAAFDTAIKIGFRAIELDVHLTRDGALIIGHDDTFDGVAIEALSRRDFSHDVPLLDEVFERYGNGIRYIVDLKASSAAREQRLALAVERKMGQLRIDAQRVKMLYWRSTSPPSSAVTASIHVVLPGQSVTDTLLARLGSFHGIGFRFTDDFEQLDAWQKLARKHGMRVFVYIDLEQNIIHAPALVSRGVTVVV